MKTFFFLLIAVRLEKVLKKFGIKKDGRGERKGSSSSVSVVLEDQNMNRQAEGSVLTPRALPNP